MWRDKTLHHYLKNISEYIHDFFPHFYQCSLAKKKKIYICLCKKLKKRSLNNRPKIIQQNDVRLEKARTSQIASRKQTRQLI